MPIKNKIITEATNHLLSWILGCISYKCTCSYGRNRNGSMAEGKLWRKTADTKIKWCWKKVIWKYR